MYQKDKSHRITLRLNDLQFEFVKKNADALDVSPSDFLRMVINSTMSITNRVQQKFDSVSDKVIMEEAGRANDKSYFDN